jgi:hypothetical protein
MNAKALRDNPGWTSAERIKWVGEQTGRLMRETANASSPLDYGYNQLALRGTSESGLLLFKSDTIKAWNRMQRARVDGNWKVWAAEGANLVANVAVKRGWSAALVLLGASLTGNKSELEKLKRQLSDPSTWFGDIAQQVAGQASPIGGETLVSTIRNLKNGKLQQDDSPFDTGMVSAAKGAMKDVGDIQAYLSAMSEGDKDKMQKRMARLLTDVGDSVSQVAGNPLHPFLQAGEKVYHAATNGPDEKFFRGEAELALKAGKPADAAEALTFLLDTPDRKEMGKTARAIAAAMKDKGPRGDLSKEKWGAKLMALPGPERRELLKQQAEWELSVHKAVQAAIRNAEHPTK